jgi:preprotein translocase subunit SecG
VTVLIPILFTLLILVCLALVGLILLQRGKGGGLVGLGGGGVDQAFGTHAASAAQKLTAILAISFIVLAAVLGKLMMPSTSAELPPEAKPAAKAPLDAEPGDKAEDKAETPAKPDAPAETPDKSDAPEAPAKEE